MGYKGWGVTIEGIGAEDNTVVGPAVFYSAPFELAATVNLGAGVARTYKDAMSGRGVGAAVQLDPVNGALRGSDLMVSLNGGAAVCGLLLSQAVSRSPSASLVSGVAAPASTLLVTGTLNAGQLYWIGEEVIRVNVDNGGGSYAVSRARAGTVGTAHRARTGLYTRPNFWVGRTVRLYEFNFTGLGALASIVLRAVGYLSEAPSASNSTSRIDLKITQAIDVFRLAEVNRAAVKFTDTILTAFDDTGLGGRVRGSVGIEQRSGVRKFIAWGVDGNWRALQVEGTVVLARDGVVLDGVPELFSARPAVKFGETAITRPPYFELAVWSKALDQKINAVEAGSGVSPTINCAYPYHPLTIAAALLASSYDADTEDPSVFDVMHPNFTIGLESFLGLGQFINAIDETRHLEVDHLVLGWNGEPTDLLDFIITNLLAPYGFGLTITSAGTLIPITFGLSDVGDFASADAVQMVTNKFDWRPSRGGATDEFRVVVGELPWFRGEVVTATSTGPRTDVLGSRATRLVKPSRTDYNFPTINRSKAQTVAAQSAIERLLWSHEGLPEVDLVVNATNSPLFLGQRIIIAPPPDLVSDILFTTSGQRVSNWSDTKMIGQIIGLRHVLSDGVYEIKVLLTNYAFGGLAKWRAPSARIKSRAGSGVYVIEGTTSDFDSPLADGRLFTVGDQLRLRDRRLADKGVITRSVVSVVAGADVTITLSDEFTANGAANDFLELADSDEYTNAVVVGAFEPYPYVFATDGAVLNRPSSATTPPDIYA